MSDLVILERSDTGPKAGTNAETSYIDCDIHPIFPVKEIYKRMSKRALRGISVSALESGGAREHNRCLMPTESPLRLDARPPGGGAPGSDCSFVVKDWLNPQNIAAAIMMPMQGSSVIPWGNEIGVSEFLSALNDYFLDEWNSHDRRFRSLISVSPHDPEAAVREVERMANRPGVAGINIPLAEVSLGRASLFRLYEAAAHHGLPILLHPTGCEGNLTDSHGFSGGVVRTYPEHHAMLLQTGQAACAALAMSGVLAKLPRLKVVFVEFGCSWVPSMMYRLDTAWERAGGSDGVFDRKPSEYLVDQVRFTTQPFDECKKHQDIWPLLEEMRADRTLLFSSDYPHWDADNPVSIFRGRLPKQIASRVAYENAVETFGERLWS